MPTRKTEMDQEIKEEAKEIKEETKQENAKEKKWIVKVENNPEYCGVGAGGIQFANGQAETKSERMAKWFEEHKGYSVAEK